MDPPEKRARVESSALIELKAYGNLNELVDRCGRLPSDVKALIEQIDPAEIDQYLAIDCHGQKLFTSICQQNYLEDIRYAIEKLRLNRHSQTCDPTNECWCCPISLALRAKSPKPAVLNYLIEQGTPVSSGAFAMWSLLSVERTDIRGILEILLRFGRDQLPPVEDLLTIASEKHVNIMCEFIHFSLDDMYKTAERGYISSVELMSMGQAMTTTAERNKLADIFEMCEVARYSRSKDICDVMYFRRSATLRETPREPLAGPVWTFGDRRMFETVEEIDSLQEQIDNNDYLETSWQLLLASVRHGHLPDGIIESRFFWRLRNKSLRELAEIKSFVLVASDYPMRGPLILQKILREIFLNQFWSHCITILQNMESLKITLLPQLYECFMEAHEQSRPRWPLLYLRDIVNDMDITNIDQDMQAVELWQDECLFLLALLYNSDRIGDSAQRIIISLLRRNANLMVLPGQYTSTLTTLLRNTPELPEPIRKELLSRTCCKMDMRPDQQAMLFGDASRRFRVRSLRCSAAIACKRFSYGILEWHLPADLVPVVVRHPFPR